MDKLSLSKRLAGFAEVFKQETKFARDLKAMSMVLESLPEEKFASLMLAAEEASASDATVEAADKAEDTKAEDKADDKSEDKAEEKAEAEEKEAAKEEKAEAEEADEKEASEGSAIEGTYWNEQASRAVLAFLRKDVLGEEAETVVLASEKKEACETVPAAKLSPEQVPDGKGNKPAATLTPDQVPKQEEVIDSGMVEKSKGPVRKQASAAAAQEMDTMIAAEGVELTAPMEDVVLSSEEAEKLSMLFD